MTNTELLEQIVRANNPVQLLEVARDFARRLDIIAKLNPESTLPQAQMVIGTKG